MNKMKIWLVLDSRSFGGIESHVEQLALNLKKEQLNVTVVFLNSYGDHPILQRLIDKKINYLSFNGKYTPLLKHIYKYKPEIIHTHGYKAGIVLRPVCKLFNIKSISTFHSGEKKAGRLKIYDLLDRYTAFLADKVLAVSDPILETLPCTASRFDNFINTEKITPSKGKQIAFVGRLSYEKAPDRFIALSQTFTDVNFDMYGDGPLVSVVSQTGIKNLHIHGQQTNMNSIWEKIGLLIIPSRAEGLPMAALEAMARGIPIIAFDVGGLKRLIKNEVNGRLIPPNDMKSLYNAVQTWLDTKEEEKQKWRLAAIKQVQTHYSSQVAIPKLLKTYAVK